MKNCQVAAVIALPQRGQSVDEDAQLVPQLEQVEQPVQPLTLEILAEHPIAHVLHALDAPLPFVQLLQ